MDDRSSTTMLQSAKKGETIYVRNINPGNGSFGEGPEDANASEKLTSRVSMISSEQNNLYLIADSKSRLHLRATPLTSPVISCLNDHRTNASRGLFYKMRKEPTVQVWTQLLLPLPPMMGPQINTGGLWINVFSYLVRENPNCANNYLKKYPLIFLVCYGRGQ